MKLKMTKESDNISQLPDHITDQILSCLSIKDAVKTSILSTKWRYKWSSLPELVFDDQCTSVGGVPSLQPSLDANLVKTIDTVLLLHTGPIQKFQLSHTGFSATSDIDRWILHLSRVSVKAIVLHIRKGQKYRIPISLFNCQELNFLKLCNCVVKIPSTFEGLKNLQILHFKSVELSPDMLEALISRCPLLKKLVLVNLKGIWRVNIKARNLKSLRLRGAIPDVTLGDVDCLQWVMINAYDDFANRHGPSDATMSNLHKFFRNLPRTPGLKLEKYSLKYLAVGNVPQTLPNALVHLTCLITSIDFNSVEEILTVICLIKRSPQLREVRFKARAGEQPALGTEANSWEDHQSSCCQQVRVASLIDISGGQPELRFIKFLLSHLPGLQKMRIKPKYRTGNDKLFRELLRFPRSSAQAELIFLDPANP